MTPPPKPMGGIGHTGLLLKMGSRFRVPPMFHCANKTNNGTPTVFKVSCAGWVTRRCCSMGASSEAGTDTTCIPSNGVYDNDTSLLIYFRREKCMMR